MAKRPKMPVPKGELSPQQLADRIQGWAQAHGYDCEQLSHGGEFAKVFVHDPAGGFTHTTIPNAHQGRRLRKDQVRYVVKKLNNNWKG
jgi:hypothetical protein